MNFNNIEIIPNASTILARFGYNNLERSDIQNDDNICALADYYRFNLLSILTKIYNNILARI